MLAEYLSGEQTEGWILSKSVWVGDCPIAAAPGEQEQVGTDS